MPTLLRPASGFDRLSVLVALAISGAAGLPALAADVDWNGPLNTPSGWEDSSNWVGGVPPDLGDQAIFSLNGPQVVTITSGTSGTQWVDSIEHRSGDLFVSIDNAGLSANHLNLSQGAGTNSYVDVLGATGSLELGDLNVGGFDQSNNWAMGNVAITVANSANLTTGNLNLTSGVGTTTSLALVGAGTVGEVLLYGTLNVSGAGDSSVTVSDGAVLGGGYLTTNIGTQGGSGTQTVTQGGAFYTDALNVGGTGAIFGGNDANSNGSLLVRDGGYVGTATLGLAGGANSNGSIRVDGAGSQLETFFGINVGGDDSGFPVSGNAELSITDGGLFTVGQQGGLSNWYSGVGATSTLTVDGVNQNTQQVSEFNVGEYGTLVIAGDGTSQLQVSNGGVVGGQFNTVSIGSGGMAGSATVSGGGQIYAEVLNVGGTGASFGGNDANSDGTLTISSGGSVNAAFVGLGGGQGSDATVIVDGAGSSLNSWAAIGASGNQLGLPANGDVALTIQNGGAVNISASGQNMLWEGDVGTTTTLTVDGAGSEFVMGDFGTLNISGFGTSELNVSDGGAVGGQFMTLVIGSGGMAGSATVSGGGQIYAEALIVGGSGASFGGNDPNSNGTLSVSSGGTIDATYLSLGGGMDSNATVTVDGADSAINLLGLGVGGNFSGYPANGDIALNIQNGGAVNILATGQTTDWKTDFDSTATLTVDGNGSLFNLGQNGTLIVGGEGSGASLHVSNGGLLGGQATTVTIGSGGFEGSATVSGGTIQAETVNIGGIGANTGGNDHHSSGTLTVNNGGMVNAAYVGLGGGLDSNATVNVDGSGSRIDATWIGFAGNYTGYPANGDIALNISNGGQVNVTATGQTTHLNTDFDSTATITVDGAGSQFNAGANGILNVGGEGTSTVNITNGGSVSAGSVAVGNNTYTSGEIIVSGVNSHILTTTLYVGENGTGTLRLLNGGSAEASNGVFIGSGGTLEGTGNIVGSVFVDGALNPGQSPGQIDILGDLTLGAGSATLMEIAGYTPGSEFDVINVDGDIYLDGALTLSFLGGFLPVAGDVFTFLTATGSIFGSFASVVIPEIAGIVFSSFSDGNGNWLIAANDAFGGGGGSVPTPFTAALLIIGLLLLRRHTGRSGRSGLGMRDAHALIPA